MIAWIFPLSWFFLASVRTDLDLFAKPLRLIPTLLDPFYEAYSRLRIYADYPGYTAILNTIIVSLVTTACVVALAFPAAYGFIRFPFRGSYLLLFSVAILSLLPMTAYLLPIYEISRYFGLLNTFPGIILWYVIFRAPMAAWLYVVFLRELPKDFEDAARIDGLSTFQIMWKIVLPITRSSVIAVGVLTFILCANELPLALVLLSKAATRTAAPLIIAMLPTRSPGGGLQWQRTAAESMLFSVPIFILCLFVQKYLVRGLTFGAIKE